MKYIVFIFIVLQSISACPKDIYTSQDSINLKSSDKAQKLLNKKKYKELLDFCKQELPKYLNQKQKDSLEIARLRYYQSEATHIFKDFFKSLNAADNGIKYCQNTEDGLETKALLHYRKAYAEKDLYFYKRSLTSMQTCISILENLENTNLEFLTHAYIFLSQDAAYNGNLTEANRYLRLSEKLYLDNRKQLDSITSLYSTTYDRFEVMLLYKKVYALYQLGETKQDSLKIEKEIGHLMDLEQRPDFNERHESIYYTTALNHVGDWYLTRKHEDSLKTSDFEKADYYLDLSINAVDNQNYVGDEIMFKYNKTKSLNYANKLEEADDLISDLLNRMSKNDGRIPFFYAQKGLIKAKLRQKDSALHYFYNAIQKVHSGENKLNEDYKNFKPNTTYGHTKLISRIADKLYKYYKDDKSVQKKLAKLYYLAFIQFENSYNSEKYNKSYDERLRKILNGVLKMKQKYGYNYFEASDLINRTESIQNQIAWLNFYQNRYADNMPELDQLQFKKLNLRNKLVYAKREENLAKIDSLTIALKVTEEEIKQNFPNTELLRAKDFKVQNVQSQLAANQIVLKYIIFEEEVAIIQIKKNEINTELKKWSIHEKEILHSYLEDLKSQKYNATKAEIISNLLIPELDSNINQLIINPDAELYRLAFETLSKNDTFFAEKYDINYSSSLAFIYPDVSTKDLQEREELAIYLPVYEGKSQNLSVRSGLSILDGAKKEARKIADLFSTSIYTSDSLTKQDFINTANQNKLLHLAMHAEVNNTEPGLSKFIFNNSNEDSSQLYLEEIYGMNIGADLAVLSACNTGFGKETANKSIASFQRAFTFAGIPATVASLWQVPDKTTSEIMEGFYKYLSKGQTKSKALQNAKIDFINKNKNTKFTEPYYWAGFVVYGLNTPIKEQSNTMIWVILFGVLILGLFLIGQFYKKPKIKNG